MYHVHPYMPFYKHTPKRSVVGIQTTSWPSLVRKRGKFVIENNPGTSLSCDSHVIPWGSSGSQLPPRLEVQWSMSARWRSIEHGTPSPGHRPHGILGPSGGEGLVNMGFEPCVLNH